MNDLTAAAMTAGLEEQRRATEAARNAKRRATWADRWHQHTGRKPETAPGVDINAKAEAARLATCFAEDLIAPAQQTAEILVHPALFERHGNYVQRRMPRHRHQRHANPTPAPEAA